MRLTRLEINRKVIGAKAISPSNDVGIFTDIRNYRRLQYSSPSSLVLISGITPKQCLPDKATGLLKPLLHNSGQTILGGV